MPLPRYLFFIAILLIITSGCISDTTQSDQIQQQERKEPPLPPPIPPITGEATAFDGITGMQTAGDQHPNYPNFRVPITDFTLSTYSITFTDTQDTQTIDITITDHYVYQHAYISYAGNDWAEIPLQGNLGTHYISNPGIATTTIDINPSLFSLTTPGQSISNNYLVVYTCDSTFDCYGGWQIWNFSAELEEQTQAGTTYYVSSSTGDDGLDNLGTSQSRPWQTIARVNSESFEPGDKILFKRGDVWRETLTIPSSGTADAYITFGTYGSGDKPKILGSEKATGWSEVSTNVWRSDTILDDPYTPTYYPAEVFFEEIDGTITWGENVTEVNSLANEYQWAWTADNIYVYAGSDPTARYVSVEVPQRRRGIFLASEEYVVIDGFEVAFTKSRNVAASEVPGGTGFILRNSYLHHVGTRNNNSIIYDGPYGYNLAVVRNDFLVQNNEMHDGGRRGISFHLYDNSDLTFSNITIEGNVLHDGYHGSGFGIAMDSSWCCSNNRFENIIIRDNLIYDNPDRNPVVDGFDTSSLGALRVSEPGGSIANVQIYNNVFKHPNSYALYIGNVDNISVYSNTFYEFNHNIQYPPYAAWHILMGDGSTDVRIKNNIFYGTGDWDYTGYTMSLVMSANQDISEVEVDYNLFYELDTYMTLALAGGTGINYRSINWDEFNQTFGWQSNGTDLVDPLFVDPENNDFHLQEVSPAIDVGVVIPGHHCETPGYQEGCIVWYGNSPDIGAFESPYSGRTFYISIDGDDVLGDGSYESPWASLAHACDNVTTFGDGIHVNAGDYTETEKCYLEPGVSIEGDGPSSNIISLVGESLPQYDKWQATINLQSSSEGVDGNQHISNIRMDGGLTANRAILIEGRSNVEVYDCVFEDFFYSGVTFNGGTYYLSDAPGTYATGNSFYNNIMHNCAYCPRGIDNCEGGLKLGGQDGMLIYNNTITQTERQDGYNGFPIKFYSNGHNKYVKIYNNTVIKSPYINFYDGASWDFAIELWYSEDGIEIYDNTIVGAIDIARATKGDYDYSVAIYDNVFGPDSTPADEESGVWLEYYADGVIIRDNIFNHITQGVVFQMGGDGAAMTNINITGNVFDVPGAVNGANWWGRGVRSMGDPGAVARDVNINNNVFNAILGTEWRNTMSAIEIPAFGTTENFNIKNNIMQGFTNAPIHINRNSVENPVVDGLNIENNIFYDNYYFGLHYDDVHYNNVIPTNEVTQNNIVGDPGFVDLTNLDFHIQSDSPAVDAGIDVGLTEDLEGNVIPQGDAPDIGAFEYSG